MNSKLGLLDHDLLYSQEVYQIIGCALEVSNNLGCGFLEEVYQEALSFEFGDQRLPFSPKHRIRIKYKKRVLCKKYIADFLCFDKIIVELKAIKRITEIEQAQLLNYLKATGMLVGLLINFGSPRLEWRRFVYTMSKNDDE